MLICVSVFTITVEPVLSGRGHHLRSLNGALSIVGVKYLFTQFKHSRETS